MPPSVYPSSGGGTSFKLFHLVEAKHLVSHPIPTILTAIPGRCQSSWLCIIIYAMLLGEMLHKHPTVSKDLMIQSNAEW